MNAAHHRTVPRRCPKCDLRGAHAPDCPHSGKGCAVCGKWGHLSNRCGEDQPVRHPPLRRCGKCWVVVFVGEAHVCGERRRMDEHKVTAGLGSADWNP